ncbi:MAG: nickel pincer cofactor biosynthesis protein LarB [Actinomycetota bacterium]|jgi:NCAIR mutase (PurE)-related protein|nr:nickel pincer cofactor biosynthesis protein LarB [Actinomycetota bacterium]
MDELALISLVEEIRSGRCTPDEAVARLRRLPFADLGFARVDHHRMLRQGMPEAVYGQGKSPEQCSRIVGELLAPWTFEDTATRRPAGATRSPGSPAAADATVTPGPLPASGGADGADGRNGAAAAKARPGGGPVILTRADASQLERVLADHPGGTVTVTGKATGADHVRGELATVAWRGADPRPTRVLVVTAGTSDLPVAHECTATLAALGIRFVLLADCGVAGVHRLLASADELAEADAVVVVAGMEGALASLVGGVTPAPVVAVPTSTGYGAGLEGVTALLAMHASCASGITVVGIDNGFGAACAIARILP